MRRILFLKLGSFFLPDAIPISGKYKLLSKEYCGDIIAVIDKRKFQNINIGEFRLLGPYLPRHIRRLNILRNLCYFIFAVLISTYNHYCKKRYDAIVTHDPVVAGLIGFIISKITRVKFITEVNGDVRDAFKLNSQKAKLSDRVKHKISGLLIPYILSRAHGIKFLYEKQLESYDITRLSGCAVMFHEFVPINQFRPGSAESKYILFLGYPWFLKGVDILIRAFNKICKDHLEYSLKIVGYCADKMEFTKLAAGNKQIELCDAVWYEDSIRLMQNCSIFILPSRTEGMARVLLEAMASKKPIIASNVGGTPACIIHGYNGLLFESENVDDLADKIKMLLMDDDLALKLAENAYSYVHCHLSENRYLGEFSRMIEEVLKE